MRFSPNPAAGRSPLTALAAAAVLLWSVHGAAVAAEAAGDPLRQQIDGDQRSDRNRARDGYRHPYETLRFFGLRPDLTVVEVLPGGVGYWTEILAPYLKEHGHYIAANGEKDSASAEIRDGFAALNAKIAADPAHYGAVTVSEFAGDRHDIAPPGSADLVVTFRNIHNWLADGTAEGAFRAFYRSLKPGGLLGVEEHRARTDQPADPVAKSGYVRPDVAIALAEQAGFKLLGSSEINANPRDTKDWPAGVWTLPPTLRLKDQDRDKYLAVGESDRFTLLFLKPDTAPAR